ncbi:amidohydrolase family protein [Pseudonocardia acaciae]|uniref:amidohydrolase family protein n=1 Tax=Pseudonocardia acaciae TaxID=551276 RepID=UPI00048E2E9D|nr:amidohydrolase family protein [Pseudonocardia acaciae]
MTDGATDAHLHLFPDEAAGLRAQGGERLSGHAGVVGEVRALRERGRIGRVLAITTAFAELARRAEMGRWPAELAGDERRRRAGELEDRLLGQVRAQNAWIREVSEPGIGAVVTADPTVDNAAMAADLADLVGRPEVRAVKIHPALSHVMPDHPGYLEVYRVARDAGVPVISHGGSSAGSFYESATEYCAPSHFVPVLDRFPGLTLVLAHLCQPFYDDLLTLGERRPGLCTDLSFVLGAGLLPADRLVATVRAFGVERVLFGSDFPYFDPEESLDRLAGAGFTAGELDMIRAGNAERVFW